MNLTTLRSNVTSVLGLDNTVSGDQTLLDNKINEGYTDVLLRTHCKVAKATMTLTVGSGDYTLDTGILTTIDVYLTSTGTDYCLERATPPEILAARRNSSSNIPYRYAVAGANLLMLYPTPSTADTLTIYYVPRPTALTAGTDTPSDVPAEQHKLIEWYALWRMADYDDDGSSQQGERYRGMYEGGLREFRRLIQRKGGSRLAPATLRTRRRITVPSDPSRSYH